MAQEETHNYIDEFRKKVLDFSEKFGGYVLGAGVTIGSCIAAYSLANSFIDVPSHPDRRSIEYGLAGFGFILGGLALFGYEALADRLQNKTKKNEE